MCTKCSRKINAVKICINHSKNMSSTSAATQQKFSNLRRRLDQLGYRQPLGIESLPLVERLFLDLVHTTESLKKAKLSSGSQVLTESSGSSAQVEAYKSDNAKLIKENNELHQQLIHIKEESEFTIKELKANLRKIEHEHADLKFLNNQYVHKMRSLEQESKQKTERILQLQEKNFHAVVQTPGGRKKNIPFRRQRMEIDCVLPPPETSPAASSMAPPADPYVADLLKVADDSIARLREEVRLLTDDKLGLEAKLSNLRKQVDLRDAEVDRLTRMLEGGRPNDVVALEARNRQNERTVSHLNIQVDYLQQKNRELQDRLDRMMSRALSTADVDARNYELTKELQDVDLMAQKLQMEKDKVVRVADLEIGQTKAELDKARSQLDAMDIEIAQMKDEREQSLAELESIKKELISERSENERLIDLVQKIQEDKRRLAFKVNKMVTTERDLVLEMDRLRHHHKNGMTQKRSKSSSGANDAFIKSLEEERDYWKSEVEVIQRILTLKLHGSGSSAHQRSCPASPSNRRGSTSPAREKMSRSTSPLNLQSSSDKKSSAQYESIIRALEDERNHYRQECERLKSIRSRSSSPARMSSKEMGSSDLGELIQLRRERDDLQKMLDKFERHSDEIRANVRVLTLERDNLNSMLKETNEELARARRDALRSPKSPKASLAAQAVLRRVENDRDEAVLSSRNLTVERDTLRERLKIATESHLAERAKLEQTIEDLETALNAAELNRKTAEGRLRLLQAHLDDQDARYKNSMEETAIVRDEASQHRATASQMRMLADQAERCLKDAQAQLARKDTDLQTAEEHVRGLEDQLSALRRAGQSDRDEITRLRSVITKLDQEKDDLQIAIDEKTEQDYKNAETMTSKERMVNDLRNTIVEMETVISQLKDNLASKDREVASLRRQLDSTSEELTEVGRGREVALRENRRLQDDLATMTRENQSINQDLEEALQERERLKEQTQEYITEVKRCEELLSSKERERADILDQYRSLSQEAERYETQTHHLESEGSNLKLELLTRDSDVRRMRDKLDQAEREIHEHVAAEHAYEVQLSNMAKSVASLEEAVRHLDEEKRRLLLDHSAVRDLCARLESTKDNLQRQLMTKSLDYEKLQTLLDDVKHETEMLKSQVANERSTKQNLESLIQENRTKEWQVQLAVQEKEAEIQLLRDRLQINDSKIDSQARELNQHRTRTIEIESDLERLKRQLISERFERERAIQELRRNGLSLPGEGSRLGAISPNSSRPKSPVRQSPSAKSPTEQA